jgi:hypothetical protein
MRNLTTKILLIVFILTFLMSGCGKKDENKTESANQTTNQAPPSGKPDDAAYDVKSAIVTYEIDLIGKQTQVLYIDDFGKKEARITTTEIDILGNKSKSEEVEINADGYTIKYSVEKKEGTKTKSYGALGAAKGFPKDLDNVTKEVLDRFKLKDLGKKDILGKESRGFEMEAMGMKTEVYVWKNIMLYSAVYMSKDGKPIEIKASKIELDVPIPQDKFTVPAGIKLQEF